MKSLRGCSSSRFCFSQRSRRLDGASTDAQVRGTMIKENVAAAFIGVVDYRDRVVPHDVTPIDPRDQDEPAGEIGRY